jgi:hypothetical protein
MDNQDESVGVALNALQNQNVRARKKRLRMARGRSHRSPRLEHSLLNVFYAGLHQICGRAQFRIPKSTLAAAELTERICCGLELDPKYVDVIVRRWQTLSGKTAKLDGDGRTFEEIARERRSGAA